MIEGTQALLQKKWRKVGHWRTRKQNNQDADKYPVDRVILFQPKQLKVKVHNKTKVVGEEKEYQSM